MKNIVVLISGNGSNLQAIIDACESGHIQAKVSAVFSNKADAYGLERAENHGIVNTVLLPADFINANDNADKNLNREVFDTELMKQIDAHNPDLVVLAGYMRILSPAFVKHYQGRMLNIHPSLLPKYSGLHTHQRAIDAGDLEHGTSVHFVTEELDGGPVVLQAKVPIFEDDNVDSLTERVQTQEYSIYPLAIQWFIDGRLAMQNGKAYLDDIELEAHGYAQD